jgi:hypothetical protein
MAGQNSYVFPKWTDDEISYHHILMLMWIFRRQKWYISALLIFVLESSAKKAHYTWLSGDKLWLTLHTHLNLFMFDCLDARKYC